MGSATPPPPCFNDVVDAQRWALKVLQQTEEEANRRGCRGSRAWEDAWRDALWTLAVQKRCVEVEPASAAAARRSRQRRRPRPPSRRPDRRRRGLPRRPRSPGRPASPAAAEDMAGTQPVATCGNEHHSPAPAWRITVALGTSRSLIPPPGVLATAPAAGLAAEDVLEAAAAAFECQCLRPARKCCGSPPAAPAAAAEAALPAAGPPPAGPPAAAAQPGQVAQVPPPGVLATAPAAGLAAEDALRAGAAAFERQCLRPVHQRLDSIEERLARMVATVQAVRSHNGRETSGAADAAAAAVGAPRASARGAAEAKLQARGGACASGGASGGASRAAAAGPLPDGRGHGRGLSDARGGGDGGGASAASLWELERQLAECAARAEAEAARRGELERHCDAAQRQLQHVEVQSEEARAHFRRAERRAEEEARQRERAEADWQQRHAALRRQLRRTELALGEEPSCGGNPADRGLGGFLDASASSASFAVLERWRQARGRPSAGVGRGQDRL